MDEAKAWVCVSVCVTVIVCSLIFGYRYAEVVRYNNGYVQKPYNIYNVGYTYWTKPDTCACDSLRKK